MFDKLKKEIDERLLDLQVESPASGEKKRKRQAQEIASRTPLAFGADANSVILLRCSVVHKFPARQRMVFKNV